MSDPREGSLRRLEEGGTAGVSETKQILFCLGEMRNQTCSLLVSRNFLSFMFRVGFRSILVVDVGMWRESSVELSM